METTGSYFQLKCTRKGNSCKAVSIDDAFWRRSEILSLNFETVLSQTRGQVSTSLVPNEVSP